jgi:hypothetical protein
MHTRSKALRPHPLAELAATRQKALQKAQLRGKHQAFGALTRKFHRDGIGQY